MCCGTSGAPKTWASHTGGTARHTWQGTQTRTTRAAKTTAKAWLDTVSITGVLQSFGQRRNRHAWPHQRQKQRFTDSAKRSRKHFTYKGSWSALARRNKQPISATPNRVWHWSRRTLVATRRNISRQHGGLIHKRVGQNQDDTAHERSFSQAGVSGSDGWKPTCWPADRQPMKLLRSK